MDPLIPFNRSSLQGRELEYIFQTITVGQIAGDQTFSKKCNFLLEETLGIYPQQATLLEQIIQGPLLNAGQLGAPPDEYRKPPASHGTQTNLEI